MRRHARSATVSHQNVRIRPGRHTSPAKGVSVTELASMLAGEPFTDQPMSVCPVLASFLRTYNDAVDAERRRDLFRYAAAIVGTASSAEVTQARSERALEWGLARRSLRSGARTWFERSFAPPPPRASRPDLTGAFAGAHAGADRGRFAHAQALMLVDELLLFGDEDEESWLPARFDVGDVLGMRARP
jgi:hypothetical protein